MDIKKEDLFNSEFLKQFKDSGEFSNFMEELYKRGVDLIQSIMLFVSTEASFHYSGPGS